MPYNFKTKMLIIHLMYCSLANKDPIFLMNLEEKF